MSQPRQQFHKPLTVAGGFHADPRSRRKSLVKLFRCSRRVHQLLVSRFSGLAIQPGNLLPTRVKIASNNYHKAPFRFRSASVLNQKPTRSPRSEPSLLSNQGSGFWYPGLGVESCRLPQKLTIIFSPVPASHIPTTPAVRLQLLANADQLTTTRGQELCMS